MSTDISNIVWQHGQLALVLSLYRVCVSVCVIFECLLLPLTDSIDVINVFLHFCSGHVFYVFNVFLLSAFFIFKNVVKSKV